MPSALGKPTKPTKPAKPEKEKPFSLPSIPLEFMPPAANHPNRLVAVTDADGQVIFLAFSNGTDWATLVFGDYLEVPVVPDNPEIPVVQPPEE
jgi:hypothetical protein